MAAYTTCRIANATNDRLKELLKNSRLSRDQFVDYILEEAMNQIDGIEAGGVLPHVNVLRRELGRPPLETDLASRVLALEHRMKGSNYTPGEPAIPIKAVEVPRGIVLNDPPKKRT